MLKSVHVELDGQIIDRHIRVRDVIPSLSTTM